MAFLEPRRNFDIYYYEDYHPYWLTYKEVKNPERNDFTTKMMDFKKGNEAVIKYFANVLSPEFKEGIAVCHVPSHDPEKTTSSIRKVAQLIARKNRHDATSCLVRYKLIEKLATGGNRSRNVHFGSIRVENEEIIAGKTVLLLDDITTTHNSLMACRELLLNAGAQRVTCYALGQTTHTTT
jgi:predicted amidophosphoribosyltransferase